MGDEGRGEETCYEEGEEESDPYRVVTDQQRQSLWELVRVEKRRSERGWEKRRDYTSPPARESSWITA